MRLRASLAGLLVDHIAGAGLDEATAAAMLGVGGPRIADLMHGRIEHFSLDTLVNMLAATGLRLKISIAAAERSEEHTSELQSLMRISYAGFCLKKKKNKK